MSIHERHLSVNKDFNVTPSRVWIKITNSNNSTSTPKKKKKNNNKIMVITGKHKKKNCHST